mmetsp:Transcript_174475/g.424464  ORF Transcript_174475/g.424464 Transcript_174475/m.424464 type:complete len:296 (+) Transcript_174475:390-1277(+)
MVRRLVQGQDVRLRVRDKGEDDTALDAVGQEGHLLRLVGAGDSKTPEVPPELLLGLVGVQSHDVLEWRLVHVESVDEMLRVPADPQVSVRADVAARRDELPADQLEQSGLAHAVCANQSDPRIQINAEVDVAEQDWAAWVAKGDLRQLQHRRRDGTAVREAHQDGLVLRNPLSQSAADHLCQGLLLALGLPCHLLRSVTELRDVLLHGRNLVLLPLVTLHLVILLLLAGGHKLVVVTAIVVQALLVHVDDLRANTVEEVLRVGHNEQDALPTRQVRLEPHHGFHVQMVRGLIQQQ